MFSLRSIIWIAIIGFAETSWCVCLLDDYSVAAEYARSESIITGVAVASSEVPESEHYNDGTNYTIKVLEVFRDIPAESVVIFSENSSGRFPMQVGAEYLLFLYRELGHLSADNCGNSGLLAEKQEALQTVREIRQMKIEVTGPNKDLHEDRRKRRGDL